MKDYRDRVNQVVADRVDLLARGTPLLLLRAPAGAHQDRFRADGVAEIDVEPLVADHPRLLRIDAEIAHRIVDHAGQRLAAAAIDAELLHRATRMVLAVIQRIEIGAAGLQPPPHLVVADLDEAGIDQAMRDARLIGDDDQRVAGALQQPQRIGRPRKQLEILEPMQITDVDVERAVTIEKDWLVSCSSPKSQGPSTSLHIAANTSLAAMRLMQR